MKPRRIAILPLLLLPGCITVGPDYHPPATAVPKSWGIQQNNPKTASQLQTWWQQFNDDELNRLMGEAIASNLDLKQALAKIKDLRAQRQSIFADALPEFSGKSTVSRRYNNSSSSSRSGAAQGSGFGIGNNLINIFQNGFDAQWELDFFGGVQRGLEAADATIASEQENSHAVQATLLAEVARYYLQLRENQQLLAITEKNLENQQQTLNLIQIRQQAGFTTMLEVNQAQAKMAELEARLPGYRTQLIGSAHAISTLLGRQPNELANRLLQSKPIPKPANVLWPDLPSELLQRRPDIRRAERQLAAATANIGVATTQLYPKINLSTFLGLQNTKITDVTPLGKSWSTSASLTMPILNWGKITANIDSKKAQAEQLGLAYQATILLALKEVEDALAAYQQELQRNQSLEQAVTANRLSVQLATERHQKGLTGFLDVLDSQQSLQQAQIGLAGSDSALSNNLVRLYKALGGGWQNKKVDGDN